jgi:hypothetical protein
LLFWLATSNKLLDMSLGFSVDLSARTILYQPLPPGKRLQVQTMAEGVVQPLANGAAGLALLALGALFAFYTTPLILGVLLTVIAWAIVVFWLGREYPKVLVQALAKRRLEGILQVCDALSGYHEKSRNQPAAAICAARLGSLTNLFWSTLPECCIIRRWRFAGALQRIERLGMTSALPAVKEICQQDSSPTVVAAAVQTLAVLGKRATFDDVFQYLDHPDRQVRLSAITGLVRSGGDADGNLLAEQRLLSMVDSSQADERLLAAQALGEISEQRFYQPMLTLLGDEDPGRPSRRSSQQRLMTSIIVTDHRCFRFSTHNGAAEAAGFGISKPCQP